MNLSRFLTLVSLLLVCGLAAPFAAAQQGCQPPPVPPSPKEPSIFTEGQENDLGDAVAENLHRIFRVIEDDEVTAFVRRLGARILKHFPPTNLRFHFNLFDQPFANAFTLPGGRIYLSRKLVALARSEDEVAGVLAHEIGHAVTRDSAIRMSRFFKMVLGVTQVGDRRDIFQRYHQFVENAARNPKAFRENQKQEQRVQIGADQNALHAVAAAGYAPQAYAEFWDRYTENKGKTGSWFSDFFGFTKPESRRLREMLKVMAALPAACVESPAAGSAEEFQAWKAAVVGYSGLGHKESLHSVQSKRTLAPPLQDDITYLKFSPDGRYLLAQDDASIHVLSRDPFEPLFRIDAPEAHPAQFTPDSQAVVFHNSALRVERWDVTEEQRTDVFELVVLKGCLQTALSPDGKILACYNPDLDLVLYEVASGTQVFLKKTFYQPETFGEILRWILALFDDEGNAQLIHLGFSPDARYFAAGKNYSALAVDLNTRSAVSLPGSLKRLLGGGFAFIGPDRLIGVNLYEAEKSAIAQFPSGEVISKLTLGNQRLAAPGRGEYVLLRPIDKYPVGVMDLKTKKIFMANKKEAFDIYDRVHVSEKRNAELAL